MVSPTLPAWIEKIEELEQRWGTHCHYCGVEIVHITNRIRELLPPEALDILDRRRRNVDHIMPRARGGPDTLANMIISCRTCNLRKGAKPYSQFWLEIATARQAGEPDWWEHKAEDAWFWWAMTEIARAMTKTDRRAKVGEGRFTLPGRGYKPCKYQPDDIVECYRYGIGRVVAVEDLGYDGNITVAWGPNGYCVRTHSQNDRTIYHTIATDLDADVAGDGDIPEEVTDAMLLSLAAD